MVPLFVNPSGKSSKGGSSKLRAAPPTPAVHSDSRFGTGAATSNLASHDRLSGGTAQPLAAPLAGTTQQPPANAPDAGAVGGQSKQGLFGNSGLRSALFNLRPNRFVRGPKDKSMPRLI